MDMSTCPTCQQSLPSPAVGTELRFCSSCGTYLTETDNDAAEMLFAEAVQIDARARYEFIRRKCAGNDGLLRRLEELLHASDTTDGLLDEVSQHQLLATKDVTGGVSFPDATGQTIGNYKLLQKVGEGGFGVVYMAEQLRPVKRKVAFKVIKPGMDSKAVLARFEAERQALAMMDHSHIASVYDGGSTPEGRPYFVMELVKGVPITTYCDDNRLAINERLKLFVHVCEAIQHAHQKGIIHRDVKPANVMVTLHDGRPFVKVIDFGVAKAMHNELTEKTLFTAYGQMIGTPQYMSPEQAEMSGLDVDTRSDIYSLGVLLYELLTGTTPLEVEELRAAGLGGIQKLIKDKEAPRPSLRLSSAGERLTHLASQRSMHPGSLPKQIRGELDWIVMKALAKERERRYDTATSLADDISRYLDGDTVSASPPSAAYRWRKLIGRHKKVFIAMGATFSALALGLVLASWQWHRADNEMRRAEAEKSRQEIVSKELDAALATQSRSTYEYGMNAAYEAFNRGNRNRFMDVMGYLDTEATLQFRGFEWDVIYPKYQELLDAGQRSVETSATVTSIAHHPNGEMVAIACNDGSVAFHDRATLEPLPRPADLRGKSLAFTPRGAFLIASDMVVDDYFRDTGIQIWRCEDWRRLSWTAEEGFDHPLTIALSPDESFIGILSEDNRTIQVRRIDDGEIIGEWGNATNEEDGFSPQNLWFRPDGSLFVAGYEYGDLAIQHRTIEGLLKRVVKASGHFYGLPRAVLSLDGTRIVTGDFDSGVHLWNVNEVGIQYRGKITSDSPYFLGLKQDMFCIGGSNQTVRLWDADRNEEVARILQTSLVTAVAVSPDNRELAIGTRSRAVEFWDATNLGQNTIAAARTSFPPLELLQSGHIVCAIDEAGVERETIRLWNPETDDKHKLWEVPKRTGAVAFSPKLEVIASASDDGTVRFKRLNGNGAPTELPRNHSDYHASIEFAPDGETLVAVSNQEDAKLWFWDLKTRQITLELDAPRTTMSLAFHPRGDLLAVGSGDGPARDGELAIWDLRGPKPVRKRQPYPETVRALAFSPDGELLALTSQFSAGEVTVVDPETTSAVFPPIDAHANKVTALTFSPEGSRLITGGDDGFVRFWELEKGRRVGSLYLGGRVRKLKVFADGHALVAYDEHGAVRYWPTSNSSEELPLKPGP